MDFFSGSADWRQLLRQFGLQVSILLLFLFIWGLCNDSQGYPRTKELSLVGKNINWMESWWFPETTKETGCVYNVIDVIGLLSRASTVIGGSERGVESWHWLTRSGWIKLCSEPESMRAEHWMAFLEEEKIEVGINNLFLSKWPVGTPTFTDGTILLCGWDRKQWNFAGSHKKDNSSKSNDGDAPRGVDIALPSSTG